MFRFFDFSSFHTGYPLLAVTSVSVNFRKKKTRSMDDCLQLWIQCYEEIYLNIIMHAIGPRLCMVMIYSESRLKV